MKIYFASTTGLKEDEFIASGVVNRLFTFHERGKVQTLTNKKIILDSGGFQEMTLGKTVDVDELCKFIKEWEPEYYIQYDIIGDHDKTWGWYQYMRSKDTNPMGVIHAFAPDYHIERVLAEANYICIGGLVPHAKSPKKVFQWLDRMYSKYELYKRKVHFLGIASRRWLGRYPVYSADASSWSSLARYKSGDNYESLIQKMDILSPKNTLQKIEHRSKLYKIGIKKMLETESYITKLWEKRGIKW